jgi:glutaryl-CoA dehydrogenase
VILAPLDLIDVDSLHSEEELAVRALVRRVMDERIRPHVAGWYADGAAPVRELARELAGIGLLGMRLTGYGCAGASAVAYGLACLELEAADSGVRSLVSVQGSLAMEAIWQFGSAEQKQQWLPAMAAGEAIGCFALTEPEHGSDPASMATRATRDGSDWVLRGTKTWITNATVADVAVVWARTEDGVAGFLVETDSPGVSATEIGDKLSLRASRTGELVLDDVRVLADCRLPLARGLRAPLACLNQARYGIVWGAVGAARDCLHTALAYAGERSQFGRPIAGFQLTQAKLADAAVELGKGYLLALHLGRRADAGTLTPEQVSVGKLNNVREALGIARACRAILGANGISGAYPVMRHMSNLETVLTYEGTAEIHQLIIGQKLTGLSAFS